MDEQRFNMSMRKYLKEVGLISQQAIEKVVRDEGLEGKGKLKMKVVLTAAGTGTQPYRRRRDRAWLRTEGCIRLRRSHGRPSSS